MLRYKRLRRILNHSGIRVFLLYTVIVFLLRMTEIFLQEPIVFGLQKYKIFFFVL